MNKLDIYTVNYIIWLITCRIEKLAVDTPEYKYAIKIMSMLVDLC